MYSLLFTILVMVFTTIQSLQAKVWDNDTITKVYKESQEKSASVFLTRLMDMPVQEHEKGKEESIRQNNRAETVLSIFGTMGPFTPKGTMRGYMKGWSVSAIKTALDTLGEYNNKGKRDLDERFNSLFNLNTLNDDLMTNEAYQRHLEALWIIFQTYHKVKVKEVTPLTKIKKDGKEIKISVKEPVDHEVKRGKEGKEEVKSQDELFQEKANRYQGLFQQASAWDESPANNSPVEIQEKILGYVTAPNDIKNARLVNRQWNAILHKLNPKPLIIDLSKLNSLEELDTILKNAEGVEWVKIEGESDNTSKGFHASDVVQKVGKTLGKTLRGLVGFAINLTSSDVLQDFHKLEFLLLDISGSILENLVQMDNLKSLKILYAGNTTAAEFTRSFQKCTSKENFKLDNLIFSPIYIGEKNVGLDNLKKIKTVEIVTKHVINNINFDNHFNPSLFDRVETVALHSPFINYIKGKEEYEKKLDLLLNKENIKSIILYKWSNHEINDNFLKNLKNKIMVISKNEQETFYNGNLLKFLWKDIIPDLPKEFMKG